MNIRTHASPEAYDPFADSYGPVGHALHFQVERIPGGPGEPARFRKTIKPGVGTDLLPMIHRENLLLMDMAARGLRHVAQSLAFTRDSSDTPFVVTTLDAGPSLNLWRRYEFVPAGGAAPQALLTPATFLQLLRHLLLALREFHGAGFVHCDIHAGNICLPFERAPGDAVRPLFEGLRLIDFGHTLSTRLRFDEPLRLDPDAPESLRRVSPAFRAALRQDAAQGRAEAVLRLDGRLDLYALGALAGQLQGGIDWSGQARAAVLYPAMTALVDRLLALDCDGSPVDPGLHDSLLATLEPLLREGGPADAAPRRPRLRPSGRQPETARETPLVVAPTTSHTATATATRLPGEPAPVPTQAPTAPVRGRRLAGLVLGLAVLAGALGWLGWQGLQTGDDPDATAAATSPGGSAEPSPPAPLPPDPPERAATYRAVDEDLNRMIQAAAGSDWPGVEAAARRVTVQLPSRPPPSPSPHLVAGERAVERAAYAEAAASLRRAIDQTPQDWAVWSAYGYALLRLGDLAGAREALGRGLRLRPHDASAWAHLAEVLALQGRRDAAAAALRLSVYYSSQRPRTLAHLRATGADTRIAPALQAVVRELGGALDHLPERSP
ncbi:tetratricopeptide repeat protein [Ramlibacter sp. AW1]|uniref:Tetratricopeptide repeat protein n=1 Tax=Ramlibacter aurantiacus TaxID=2801330 RepID=A0A936ZD12_9BURK|nr:tetratricopeptide repeat protein [Ramlibacter aurantiacus]MBL0419364.1 tetratricopeptide repeat protein [Ramlibacter aurantiacus]